MTFDKVVRIERDVRSRRDSRRKVNRHILSYLEPAKLDALGNVWEYRIGIETPRGDYELRPCHGNGLGNAPCVIAIPETAKSTLEVMRIADANVLAHAWTQIHHKGFQNSQGKV